MESIIIIVVTWYNSKGLNNLEKKISESIRTHTYLMITLREHQRHHYFPQIFKDNFENVINRSVNTEEDIQRYQNVLIKYSSSEVDYNIAEGAYMCPSDMKISNINWSNKLNHKSNKIGKVENEIGAKNDKISKNDKVSPSHEKTSFIFFNCICAIYMSTY